MNTFLDTLEKRGMLSNYTNGCYDHLENSPITGYIGFDPTAESLTIGNYVQLNIAKLWMQAGYELIILIGGATALIGDPSGKEYERDIENNSIIAQNSVAIEKQIRYILRDFPNYTIVNNIDFYKNMNVIDYMRDVGKYNNMNDLLRRQHVKDRLSGTGLSYTEFSYQVFQGYDFYYLVQNFNCTVQIGGSDQWGNIITGCKYISHFYADNVHGITTNLLLKADGSKFGKTGEGENLWLDRNLTHPWDMYQYFINTDDADLKKYASFLTSDLDLDIFNDLSNVQDNKKLFIKSLMDSLYGNNTFEFINQTAKLLFSPRLQEIIDNPNENIDTWNVVMNNIPIIVCDPEVNIFVDYNNIISIVNTLIFPDKSGVEVYALADQGAIKINNSVFKRTISCSLYKKAILPNDSLLLQIGKTKFYCLSFKNMEKVDSTDDDIEIF